VVKLLFFSFDLIFVLAFQPDISPENRRQMYR
jgi:hypothetical protein